MVNPNLPLILQLLAVLQTERAHYMSIAITEQNSTTINGRRWAIQAEIDKLIKLNSIVFYPS